MVEDKSLIASQKKKFRPLITIITASYNPGVAIKETYKSLSLQTFRNFQWLVADGGSSDGTISWLSTLDFAGLLWFSRSDEGVYDAWNSAIPFIQGEWVLFLGAGDLLPDTTTLDTIASHLACVGPETEMVYGEVVMIHPITRRVIEYVSQDWSEIEGRWRWRVPATPPHSGVLHRARSFWNGMRFDSRFKIVGDSHFMIRSIARCRPRFLPVLVSVMPTDGISNDWMRAWQIAKEYTLIIRDLDLHPPLLHCFKDLFKIVIKVLAKTLLSRPLAEGLLNALLKAVGRPSRW